MTLWVGNSRSRKRGHIVVHGFIFGVGLVSAVTVVAGTAAGQNGFGGSIQLFSDTGDAAWIAGEDGATEWLDGGYQFSGSDSSSGWNVNWDMLGASPAQVGELFSLTALLGMASAPLGGVIADKIGLKTVIVVSLLACAVGLGLARDAEDVRGLQACIGLWGMGTAAAGPAVNALAIESAPKGGEGEALTLPKTAGDLVFLAGPIVIGLTDDALGSAGSSLFLVSGSAAVAAAGAALFLKPPNAKQTRAGVE